MTTPSSGNPISLNDVEYEIYGTTGGNISLNDNNVRKLAAMSPTHSSEGYPESLADLYGKTRWLDAGTQLSTYCSGYDYHGTYADGNYGSYNVLIEANSASCGYNPPARGTLFSTFCSGYDLYGTYADGSYGSYNALIESNSPSCGWSPPGGGAASS